MDDAKLQLEFEMLHNTDIDLLNEIGHLTNVIRALEDRLANLEDRLDVWTGATEDRLNKLEKEKG